MSTHDTIQIGVRRARRCNAIATARQTKQHISLPKQTKQNQQGEKYVSGISHTPAAGRHTVPLGFTFVVGHVIDMPSHVSKLSHNWH